MYVQTAAHWLPSRIFMSAPTHRSIRRTCAASLLLLPFIGPIGCFGLAAMVANQQKDISNDPAAWGGFTHDARYIVVCDVAIARISPGARSAEPFIENLDPDEASWDARERVPPNRAAYEAEASKWPEIEGVIDRGTTLRATHVIAWSSLGVSGRWVKARIEDGPHKGVTLIINRLTDKPYYVHHDLCSPDPRFLGRE